MIFANTNGSIAGLPIKVPMAWECPGTPKRNLSGNGSVTGLPKGFQVKWECPGSQCGSGTVPGVPKRICVEMGVSRDSQRNMCRNGSVPGLRKGISVEWWECPGTPKRNFSRVVGVVMGLPSQWDSLWWDSHSRDSHTLGTQRDSTGLNGTPPPP